MSKQYKIYVLLSLTGILLITASIAALPYLTILRQQPPETQNDPSPTIPQRQQTMSVAPPTASQALPTSAKAVDVETEHGKFENRFNKILLERRFAEIDKIAREIRASKKRFTNGRWAITRLYSGLSSLYKTENAPYETEERWKERIELLQSWKRKFPDSVTARIALATTYVQFAWFVRGSGYANTVSQDRFKIFFERIALADNELFDAMGLKEGCPEWFSEKLEILTATSAPESDFDEVFEQAIRFEPGYYPFYLLKSEALKPRWGGSLAKWQEYIKSIPETVKATGSDDGDMIYLLLSIESMRDNSVIRDYAVFSSATNRRGYKYAVEKYGVDDLLLNKYAYISILTLDRESAKEAFNQIADKPNPEVWTKEVFYNMKNMVEGDDFKDLPSTSF